VTEAGPFVYCNGEPHALRPSIGGRGLVSANLPGSPPPMNPKLKFALIALGSLAALFLVSQLVMGLLIVRGGGSLNLAKLIKAHQHSGYTKVSISLVYVALSLATIASIPARKRD